MKTMTTGLRLIVTTVAFGVLVAGTTAQAQDKMGGKMEAGQMDSKMMAGQMGGKMMAGKMSGPVYMCKDGKCYMTPADAKKVGYKDPMGGGMMKKAAMAPKMGKRLTPAMAMKMSKMGGGMMGSKMDGGKMGSGM